MQTKQNQQHSSAATLLLASSLLLLSAGWVQAKTPEPPKPGREHQKLAIWFGDWTYTGEVKDSPLGPGGKMSGRFTAHPILGGFFVEFRGHETSPQGQTDWGEIDGYDPVYKRYTWTGFVSDGSSTAVTYTLDGVTNPYTGTMITGGKTYRIRGTYVFAPDSMSVVAKQEISTDGETWAAFSENKFTKVKAPSDQSALASNSVAKAVESAIRQSWADFAKHDKSAYAADIAEDETEVWTDGKGVHDKAAVLREMDHVNLKSHSLSDFKVTQLGPEAALVTYRAKVEGANGERTFNSDMDVTEVEVKRDGKWKELRYHESERGPGKP